MTNLQALQSSINYPGIDVNAFTRVLLDRGLQAGDQYKGKSEVFFGFNFFQAFELAKADLYCELITAANVSEGDYSISISERSNFTAIANGIYSKYGEASPLAVPAAPTVTAISPW